MRPPAYIPEPGLVCSLAVVRALGRAGVPVVALPSRRLEPGQWSRYVRRRAFVPSPHDAAFLTAVANAGREPGGILFPMSDVTVWRFARERTALARFAIALAPLEAVWPLMDKSRLIRSAEAAGLRSPQTWIPEDEASVRTLAARLPYPVVLKPRTSLGGALAVRGRVVREAGELLSGYRSLVEDAVFPADVLAHDPEAARPLVQRYHAPGPGGSVYTIAGYAHRDGRVTALASRKAAQWRRETGTGLRFESAEMDIGLLEGIRRLCAETGYHGIFEAEFVGGPGKESLNDFNTRCYHEIGFEIARGLNLPLLAYAETIGDEALAATAVAGLSGSEGRPRAWVNRRAIGAARRSRARGAPAASTGRGPAVDAIRDWRDPLPVIADQVDQSWNVGWLKALRRRLGP